PPAAGVAPAERRAIGDVAGIRLHRVRRVVALFREEGDEGGDLRGHAGHGSEERGTRKAERGTEARPAGSAFRVPTSALICATKASISPSARSTRSSFFFCLSFTGRSSGSSRPKFAFIGWKGSGSAVCTSRYR